ncbi:MAG: sortase domain-containing protein, partial [Sarcina sp.]
MSIKLFRKIINILIIITSFYLTFLIGKDFVNAKKSHDIYADIKKESPLVESNETKSNSFDNLKEINPDYQFWIQINNTNIDYPVVKGTDNEYYLENDFYKKPLKDGSVFLDYKNNFGTSFNNIIFGHNMKNGNIFSNLNKFKNEDFYNTNKIIKIV